MRKLIKKILKYLGLNQKDSRIENKRLMKILTKNEFSNKYYIIRRTPLGAGLYSNFHYVLTHIIYALKNKYIPVVDMQNYKTYFNEDYPIEFISGGGDIKCMGILF
jgi:hypothetical protein